MTTHLSLSLLKDFAKKVIQEMGYEFLLSNVANEKNSLSMYYNKLLKNNIFYEKIFTSSKKIEV